MKVKLLSRVRLLATSWTAAHQALPSMGFSRQEYWSGVPLAFSVTVLGRLQIDWGLLFNSLGRTAKAEPQHIELVKNSYMVIKALYHRINTKIRRHDGYKRLGQHKTLLIAA